MTTLVAGTVPLPLEEDFALREERTQPRYSDGGRLTLGQLVDSVWEGLHAAGVAGCPACGARMESIAGAGHCGGCGASVS